MSNILNALNESLADEFMAIAKEKGYNPRLRGAPDEERARTDAMLKQRALDRANEPKQQVSLSPEEVEQLKQKLEQEQKGFDPNYEYSDDHSYWTKQKEKAQRIGSIKQQLKSAGIELNETKVYSSVSVITEARTYKLWESAGHKLVEAQLTADQIQQLFQYIEKGADAAGGNRTLIGKGKDAASAVSKAWEDLKTKVSTSGPIKNVDAMYDKAAEQLKQATGGDQGVMKYVQKYRDFAKKHPVAQSLIYSALIAAAGISGAGIGGAAALGLFKLVDKLLQGEKFSSAAYQGAKTGAMAYGASKIGDLIRGAPKADVPSGGTGAAADAASGAYGEVFRQARRAGMGAARQAIEAGQISDYNSVLTLTDQIMADVGTELSPQSYQALEQIVRTKLMAGLTNESVSLSESQIQSLFTEIVAKENLQEGVMDWMKTKGRNLTTKVTADKLMQAWKKAGSPTDSLDVASIIQNAGVSSDIIKQVYSTMKIPAPGQPGGGAQGTRDIPVDPSSVAPGKVSPTSPTTPTSTSSGQTTPTASTTAPTNKAGAGASSDYQKVKQLLAQLDKRGKMNLVKLLDKELTVTEGILALSEEEILAELSPETLASYKKKAGQSASQADKEGNYKLGDKRFSGIVRATKKELEKDVAKHYKEGVAEAGFTKTPSGDYINQHTGVRSSKPPVKKKRGEKTGAEWDAIEKAKKDKDQGVAEGSDERKQNALWAQITAHEKAAKKSKDLKQQHHLKMADQLRSQLKTSDNEQGVTEGAKFEESFDMKINELAINEDWQKVNKSDKTDGMSRKAVKAYRRENPGSKLKTAVTKKPSKLKKGSKDAKRRKSFCARMSGMKKSRASAKTKRDPNSPINKALRRWNCESVEQMQNLIMVAEQKIALLKEAANPAQQAAIAISMKKKGQKPKAK